MRVGLILFAVLAGLAGGCSGNGDGTAGSGGAQLPDVIYVGKASDEALEVVWARILKNDFTPSEQLGLSSPAPGATVSLSTAPAITWTAFALNAPAPARPRSVPAPHHLDFSLVSSAYAHLLPVTGNIYLVELTGADTIRIFSSPDATYTPTAGEWAKLTGGKPGTIKVRIWSAYLNQNSITEGVYVSPQEVSFTAAATP